MTHKEMMQALLDGQIIHRPGNDRTTELQLQLVNGQIRDIVNNCIDGMPINPTTWSIKPHTININGFEVPEPVRATPEPATTYFAPSIWGGDPFKYTWGNTPNDRDWLSRGLIHLTKEAAELHATALLSFTKL